MAYANLVVADEDSDHVEAQDVEIWGAVGEVLYGEGAKSSLFAEGYRFERVAEAGSAAQFYLDEDDGVVFAYDQVDLPVTRPVVAFDESVAAAGQVTQREVLTPRTRGLFCQSLTPA